MQHHMDVVAHNSIGIHPYCKALRQRQQAFFHPRLSVFVGMTRIRIFATKKGAANTARHTMEEAG
jgi:hypothetical protein